MRASALDFQYFFWVVMGTVEEIVALLPGGLYKYLHAFDSGHLG